MSIIANTTIVSNFAAIDHLHLLATRFDTLYISDQVYEEIQLGFRQGYDFYSGLDQQIYPFNSNGWLCLTALNGSGEFETFGELLGTLHSGEASSLSIAYHRGWTFLTDDKAARKTGKALGISISGTLGVLLSLVKDNLVSLQTADVALQQMIKTGYYSPVISLHQIINKN